MIFLSRISSVIRRWPIIAACMVLGLVAGLCASMAMKATHISEAKVYVIVAGKQTAPDMSSASQYVASQMASYETVASAPIVLDPVISKLHLDMTSTDLGREVVANAATGSFVLSIAVSDQSSQRAADIANAIASQMSVAIKDLTPVDKTGAKPIDAQTIAAAVPDATSKKAHLIRNAGGGAILGLLIGIALAFLWASVDLRRAEESASQGSSLMRSAGVKDDGVDH